MAGKRRGMPRVDWNQLTLFKAALPDRDWELLAEACLRCDMYIDQFVLQAAIAMALKIVPEGVQEDIGEVGMSLPGLFAEKMGGVRQNEPDKKQGDADTAPPARAATQAQRRSISRIRS